MVLVHDHQTAIFLVYIQISHIWFGIMYEEHVQLEKWLKETFLTLNTSTRMMFLILVTALQWVPPW